MLIKVKKKFLSIICLFFYLIITGDVFAESTIDDLFILNARKIINKNKESVIIAKGDVEVIQGKEILRADYLEFNKKTNLSL